jgi:hypothetical protein
MNSLGKTGKSGRVNKSILLVPTLPQRLTLLAILIFVVSTVIDPRYASFSWTVLIVVLFVAASLTARESIARAGFKTALKRGCAGAAGFLVISLVVILATRFVAAGGTIGATSESSLRLVYLNFDLIVVILTLLLLIPHFFFHIGLDLRGTGDAQRVFLRLIAVAASSLTGCYIVLLHFDGGPLRKISMGPLIAGVIGLVVLISPVYKSLARACWSRGVAGVVELGQYRQDWGKAVGELRQAVQQAPSEDRRRLGNGLAATGSAPTEPAGPAERQPAPGWPVRGLFTACAMAIFGFVLVVADGLGERLAGKRLDISVITAGTLLMVVALILALVCTAGALLRGIRHRRAKRATGPGAR